jgi:hypothetical protein
MDPNLLFTAALGKLAGADELAELDASSPPD